MTLKIQLIFIVFSIAIICSILELVRRKKIRPRYSIFWLINATFFLVVSIFGKSGLLELFSKLLGIYGPPNTIFIIGSCLVIVLLIHFSSIISLLFFENKKLILKLSLLCWRIEQLEKEKNESSGIKSAF